MRPATPRPRRFRYTLPWPALLLLAGCHESTAALPAALDRLSLDAPGVTQPALAPRAAAPWLELEVGASATFTAYGAATGPGSPFDSAVVAPDRISWHTADPAVATIGGDGRVVAVAPGQTTIVATAGGQTATAGVAVVAPFRAREVVVGTGTTCALDLAAGTPYCWGQVGGMVDAPALATDTTNVPRPVHGAAGVVLHGLSGGVDHFCALDAAGAAWCWGQNLYGQLGTGTTAPLGTRTPAARVAGSGAGGLAFTQVSAGADRTCALTSAGQPCCWGDNTHGGLAVGDSAPHRTPARVATADPYVQLSVGGTSICGLRTDGVVLCWDLQLPDSGGYGGAPLPALTTPTPVATPLRFTAVRVGTATACGVTTAQQLACWGTDYGPAPVVVPGTDGAVAASVGGSVVCALTAGGDARCAGTNGAGQLGVPDVWTALYTTGLRAQRVTPAVAFLRTADEPAYTAVSTAQAGAQRSDAATVYLDADASTCALGASGRVTTELQLVEPGAAVSFPMSS